jgi:hypothetical protein
MAWVKAMAPHAEVRIEQPAAPLPPAPPDQGPPRRLWEGAPTSRAESPLVQARWQ